MKKIQLASLALTAMVGTGLIAGCGTGSGANAQGSSTGPVSLKVGIWASSPAETQLVNNQVKAFEKLNPNVTVTTQVITGNYLQALQPMLASHTAPDIFYVDSSYAPTLEASGALAPLTSYIKQDHVDLSNYSPSLLKAFEWQGTVYGIPKDSNSLAIEYNPQLLAKAGISQPPKTWAEFETDAAKLKAKGIAPLSMPIDVARYYPFVLDEGGSYYNASTNKVTFNNSANIPGLQWFINNQKQGYIVNPTNLGGSWAGIPFAQGKVAMVAEGAWLIPFMQQTAPKMKYGISDFPSLNGQSHNMVYTVSYSMAKTTKNPTEAAKLLFFLTGKQGEQMTAKSGLAIPSYTAEQSDFLNLNPSYQAFVDGIKNATAYQFGTYGQNFVDAINNATQAGILKSGVTPAAVLSKAQNTVQTQSQQ